MLKRLPDSDQPIEGKSARRQVATLYIEADEDHVALQSRKKDKKKSLQVPLIYVSIKAEFLAKELD